MSHPAPFGRPTPRQRLLGARVMGVQVGQPRDYRFGERLVRSAIGKQPVSGPVAFGPLGLAGDGQVHRSVHGGPERAVCAYPLEHLAVWASERGSPFGPGSFGENLTTVGVDEEAVCLGDRFRFGSVLLEVSQPREPCDNLAGRHQWPELPARIRARGWCGWYLRVVEPGSASPGLALVREFEHPARVSVWEAFQIRLDTRGPAAAVRRLLAVEALSSGWRGSLNRRLAR